MTRKLFLKHPPDHPSAADDPNWIFLSPSQAVDAVALDFQAYGPQPNLFRRIAPLILGDQCRITPQNSEWGGVFLWRGTTFDPVTDHHLGFFLIHVLETDSPDLGTLADICGLVFQTQTTAGHDKNGDIEGVWIHAQMDRFVCRQCGQCCRTLDYETGCEEADIQRWRARGRTDILAWVQTRDPPAGDTGPTYRIWVNPDTGKTARTCPWLAPNPDHPDRFVCLIHTIKPEVCQQYPYTAKHAFMTGCCGSFAPRSGTSGSRKP